MKNTITYFRKKKEKKEKIIEMNNAVKGFISIVIFLIYPKLIGLPFLLFNINPENMSQSFVYLYSALYNASMAFILIYLFKDTLKKQWKDFKKNHKNYFIPNIKYWLIGLGGMMIVNLFIQFFLKIDLAANEQLVRNAFKESPLFIFAVAVLIAPISEELVFRQGVRNIFKTDLVFVLVSGFLFGFIHVYGHVQAPIDFIYILPYMSLGCAFAHIMTKTKNVFPSIGFHFLHNGILIGLQTLLLISEVF